ncbi:Mut7-C ubiquitin/RNAse domain-containing protein [Pontibacter burrus]|uniref:Mut7-C ubiquitin/RNAse domain-containing protein n=1 Tax=Pontibacter burrus TaxID=2704466 RepID=A0A6B3LKY2_9BACT|nr:Mut7-C ubiquitin/RNAse domain-containing protein [Pontibacter burrus]NEM97592.1 Mut7-C ubiquitin/RNAse domain-containing protein [Pontibacter burrus]
MGHTARFKFHTTLNDFLQKQEQESWINYSFRDVPAIKDAIEAIGVPHPEVNAIVVNGRSVDFTYKLHPDDKVEVYPKGSPVTINLFPNYNPPFKFVLDVHLGKLARMLRLLGFDTIFDPELTEKELVAIAVSENRILLSRGTGILKHKTIVYGYWLRSQQPDEQLQEVIRYYNLAAEFSIFTRCMVCNGAIAQVTKEQLKEQLPPKTKLYFHEFYQCQNCQRVYWKGSHYERMQEFIQKL